MELFRSFRKKDLLEILSGKLQSSNPYVNKLEVGIFQLRIVTIIKYMSELYYLAKTQFQMGEDIDVVVEKFIAAPSTDKSLDLVYQHTFGGAIGVLLFIAEPSQLSAKEYNTCRDNIKKFLVEKGISNTKIIVDTAMAFYDDLTSGTIAVHISKCTAAMLDSKTTDLGFFDPNLNLLLIIAVTKSIVDSRNRAMSLQRSHPNFKSDCEETKKLLVEVGILPNVESQVIIRQLEEDVKHAEKSDNNVQEESDANEYYDDTI